MDNVITDALPSPQGPFLDRSGAPTFLVGYMCRQHLHVRDVITTFVWDLHALRIGPL